MQRYNAHAAKTIILSAICCPLALVCVLLRFYARAKTKASVGLDDWLAVLSLVSFFAYCGVVLWGVENGGGGYEFSELPLSIIPINLKAAYIGTFLTLLTVSFAKLSILVLYRRAFYPDRRFRIAINIVGAFCVAWWLGASIGIAFRCLPVEKQWHPWITGKCFSLQTYFVIAAPLDCILDWVIVALPLWMINGLRLPLQQKINLCFIFILGAFVGIVSIIRTVAVYKQTGPVFLAQSTNWLQAQFFVAIVCICLPTFKPLLPKTSFLTTFRRSYASLLEKRGSSAGSSKRDFKFAIHGGYDHHHHDAGLERGGSNCDNLINDTPDKRNFSMTSDVRAASTPESRSENEYPMTPMTAQHQHLVETV